ncbi:MAG: (d)CMP kinase [Planctomycetes bacterium]|nr:(d)CMP kinase [Planctomycetota bacterium]
MSTLHALATMIIAIDGPAGSGKSTVARRLAAELGLTFLDTGAMYRAVTLAALERDVEPMDEHACGELAQSLRLVFDVDGRIRIDGKPGEPAIRSDEVTRWVSAVSAHPRVRAAIVPQQRSQAGRGLGIVAEGRDIGTVVFPSADVKFYLTASAEERARRRALERGEPERFHEFLADIQRRDHHDSTRHDSPLKQADDAILVDTDGTDADGVVAKLLEVVRGGRSG